LLFEDGNLAASAGEGLAALARREDLRVRISNHHRVAVFARDELALGAALAETRLDRFTKPGPRVVACPGTRWCARGLADTGRLAAAVRGQLTGVAVGDMLIAISGCPNGCAHSAVADVGAIGVVAGSAADRREAWNLLAGGERGQGPRLAQPVAGRVSLDEAAVKIVELAVQAAASGPAGRE
jgi:sulfite reductase beta subunit-like hemoprotein